MDQRRNSKGNQKTILINWIIKKLNNNKTQDIKNVWDVISKAVLRNVQLICLKIEA